MRNICVHVCFVTFPLIRFNRETRCVPSHPQQRAHGERARRHPRLWCLVSSRASQSPRALGTGCLLSVCTHYFIDLFSHKGYPVHGRNVGLYGYCASKCIRSFHESDCVSDYRQSLKPLRGGLSTSPGTYQGPNGTF